MTVIAGHELKAGQSWTYNAPPGYESSRLVVGAIAMFAHDAPIICVSVSGAPQVQPDGSLIAVSIPFLPMSREAFAATAEALADEHAEAAIDPGFAAALADWGNDPRGMTCFTVPFDGYLDRLIARQMAAIVGTDAA